MNFSCSITPTRSTVPLGMEVWIDDQKLFDSNHVHHKHQITTDLCDHDGEHELRLVLKNKQLEHTQLDSNNNIVSDAMIAISDMEFDGIRLNQLVADLAEYLHSGNGTGEPCVHKFYGNMGCNGTVSLKFTTPVYLWLLTHM